MHAPDRSTARLRLGFARSCARSARAVAKWGLRSRAPERVMALRSNHRTRDCARIRARTLSSSGLALVCPTWIPRLTYTPFDIPSLARRVARAGATSYLGGHARQVVRGGPGPEFKNSGRGSFCNM